MHAADLALVVQHVVPVGGPKGSPTGGAPALLSASLYVGVAAAGLAAAPSMTSTKAPRPARILCGLLATAYVASTFALVVWRGPQIVLSVFAGESAARVAVTVLHLTAVTVWVGGVLHLAVSAFTVPGDQL